MTDKEIQANNNSQFASYSAYVNYTLAELTSAATLARSRKLALDLIDRLTTDTNLEEMNNPVSILASTSDAEILEKFPLSRPEDIDLLNLAFQHLKTM